MGTFTNLTYHIVFGTKYRAKSIKNNYREQLYQYIGGIIRTQKGHVIEIGGVEDHIHILANLSPAIAVSESIRAFKANSSKWLNEMQTLPAKFEWQQGYGAFSVSFSQTEFVQEYIANLKEHHRVHTFEEEYISFLKRHNIQFEPNWLFEDEHHG